MRPAAEERPPEICTLIPPSKVEVAEFWTSRIPPTVRLELIRALPVTSSLVTGVDEPIPTFPASRAKLTPPLKVEVAVVEVALIKEVVKKLPTMEAPSTANPKEPRSAPMVLVPIPNLKFRKRRKRLIVVQAGQCSPLIYILKVLCNLGYLGKNLGKKSLLVG